MDETKKEENGEEILEVVFRNGALAKIKSIAADLNISEDNLVEVLKKSISLMDQGREGTKFTLKKGKDEYVIDLRTL